jgi:Rrf2 family protein
MRNSTTLVAHPVLSKTADYALRALLALARHGAGRPLPADSIAELTGAPANYMGKTLYALARAGMLRSARGPSGGFALAVAPESITIARIADVFAEAPTHPRCLLGARACDPAKPCTAHDRWTRVAADAREPLISTTIADLLADAEPVVATTGPSVPRQRTTTASGTAGAF